ncbi:TPA: hypothetical protein LVK80_001267 [Klebsiella michiganensis]|nr:hypothetical protein [Klebsiella michiganensis]
MTDITELAQSHELRNKVNHRLYGALEFQGTSGEHATVTLSIDECKSIIAAMDERLALVEALEKAQQHIARQEQILLNQDESLSIRRGELEAAQQERDNWRTSFDNERFRADKLASVLNDEIEQSANVRGQLLIAHKTLLNQQAKIAELEEAEQKLCAANVTLDARAELAERRLLEMESRTVTVKLTERASPSDYVDEEFDNCDLAAIHNACRLQCRVSVERCLSAYGIVVKWEAK